MRIVLITQEDSFAIPRNIQLIQEMKGVELVHIIVLDAEGSLANKKRFFIEGFGLRQSATMGLYLARNKVADLVDRLTHHHILPRKFSIESVARKFDIPFTLVPGKDRKMFFQTVKSASPDLVVSFSAPIVFKEKLLSLPRHGCINLHCSYLPNYAGLMPSFWTLYNREPWTGVTVHYMDDKIDNGAILGQEKVPLNEDMSMLDVIMTTKKIGGELMVKVIQSILDGTMEPQPNPAHDGSYNSWPTMEQLKAFRKRGGRLV